jgi:HD-GYP domain-containing protein (c-di-GMP phosphodiesterase class II)
MVYRLVNSTYNVHELTLRLTRLLCQFIKASSASVYILDPQKRKVILVAIFNNQINILLDKRHDLKNISDVEIRVTEGYPLIEKRVIGLPLIADENIGAIFIERKNSEPPFTDFDREMLSVFAEQSVTAIKKLQLYEEQQKTIMGSIQFIDKLLERKGYQALAHAPAYFSIMKALAEKMSLGQEAIDCLQYASMLHDAGAVDVPFEILSKTSKLTPEEFKIIRDLPMKSAELIKPVAFLRPVLPIILYHREKYDGTGYPSGLKKEQIPVGARIMAVVDAFEAMTRGRPYKAKLTLAQALDELLHNSGTQFDPKVVKCFSELYKQKKFRKFLSKLQ